MARRYGMRASGRTRLPAWVATIRSVLAIAAREFAHSWRGCQGACAAPAHSSPGVTPTSGAGSGTALRWLRLDTLLANVQITSSAEAAPEEGARRAARTCEPR